MMHPVMDETRREEQEKDGREERIGGFTLFAEDAALFLAEAARLRLAGVRGSRTNTGAARVMIRNWCLLQQEKTGKRSNGKSVVQAA